MQNQEPNGHETKTITISEVKNLNPNDIQSITLLDGSIVLITSPETLQSQSQIINQAKPLFTQIQNEGDQNLRNIQGQSLNNMITYNEQNDANYYGNEQLQEQSQAQEQYYNNMEEGYGQQQSDNYVSFLLHTLLLTRVQIMTQIARKSI